jgi:hypothetical protein
MVSPGIDRHVAESRPRTDTPAGHVGGRGTPDISFCRGPTSNAGKIRVPMRLLRRSLGAPVFPPCPCLGPQVGLTKLSRPCHQNGWTRLFVRPDRMGPQVKQVWARLLAHVLVPFLSCHHACSTPVCTISPTWSTRLLCF